MMRLDTDPMTSGQRTGRGPADPLPLLIQVPRVDEPAGRVRFWRPEAAAAGRPACWGASRPGPVGSFGAPARSQPRRRLRRGVRRAGYSLLVLAAMAGTFTVGWTTRGGGLPRLPLLSAAAPGTAQGGLSGRPDEWPAEVPTVEPVAETEAGVDADPFATGPALGAPVADAEVPVVFPGYLLPDNNREEPAHEGS